MKKYLVMAAVASVLVGCNSVPANKNPNIIQSPQKLAYKACMQKANGDKSKCEKERQDWLYQQEMEVMENNG